MTDLGVLYNVIDVFRTVQGEGYWAGTPAIFVRFGGCNIWSGYNNDRARDAKRNKAKCPLFCDTIFINGEQVTENDLVQRISEAAPRNFPLIVFTGGEPLLQLRSTLMQKLRVKFSKTIFAVETNGTVWPKPDVKTKLDWICLSPKVHVDDLRIRRGDELKVVFPAYEPHHYAEVMDGFKHLFVAPEATSGHRSELILDNVTLAINYIMEHPAWRLSLQTHKILGLP